MPESLVMGVDSSTQSCKVEIRTLTGDLLASGRAAHPPTTPPVSEQHPESWWDALVSATHDALAALPADRSAGDVGALSIAAQCHGLVLLDDSGRVLRPAPLWNDTTAAPQIERLREQIGADTWIRTVGSLPTSAFTIGKLARIAEHEPEVLAAARALCLPHDWLTLQATGEHVTDRSEASGTGWFDSEQDRWIPELLEAAAGEAASRIRLPRVLPPSESAGRLREGAAEELGLRPGILVGPGGGDQHVSALGLGLEHGELAYSIGTSGVVLTSSSAPVQDLSGIVDGVADAAGGWLPLVSTLNAARVLDTLAQWLGVDHAELDRLASAAPATADRPIMAAYLDGERKPDLPGATGILGGLTTATTRESLALAGVEGMALGLVRGRDHLRSAGVAQREEALVLGGGAQMRAVVQSIADLDGLPVSTTDAGEAVCRGACIQAAAVLEGEDVREVASAWRTPRRPAAEPRPGRHVDELRQRYDRLASFRGADRA
jgi:xylulokinase